MASTMLLGRTNVIRAEGVAAAAELADRAVSDGLENLVHGAGVPVVADAILARALVEGAGWAAVAVGADSRLAKARLVGLNLWGEVSGVRFRLARTGIVGYDSLTEQVTTCNRFLAELEQAIAVLPRPAAPGLDVYWVQVGSATPWGRFWLGDMVVVDAAGPRVLSGLARRLWL